MKEQEHVLMKKKKISALAGIHIVSILLVLYDIAASAISYFVALWLRFDCRYSQIPQNYLMACLKFMPVYAVVCVFVFWLFRLYRSVWKFASYSELARTAMASLILGIFYVGCTAAMLERMPASYYAGGIVIHFMLSLAVRFAYRFIHLERNRMLWRENAGTADRVMLIGAGAAGRMILRDLQNAKEVNDCVCCIIDDDKSKRGCMIDGVPIVGGRDDILLNVEKYKIEKIYLAIPSATAEERRDILNI